MCDYFLVNVFECLHFDGGYVVEEVIDVRIQSVYPICNKL